MCAIYGFAGFDEPGLLERMGWTLVHRGPDGEGQFEAAGDSFRMGMRRLSIIDLHGGFQPIYNEDRTLAVCYNGEIYNYVELRDELRASGHIFRTDSDTEVIVHAYEEWGTACVEHFNGMFAFALHDSRTGDVFLARDRCGQKPLYYWRDGAQFVFASEVKAMLKSSRVPRRPWLPGIDAYLTLRYVPEPATMFDGIFTLPAGHSMVRRRSGEVEVRRYWSVPVVPASAKPRKSDDEWLDEVEALFFDAVRLCMRSDVPVGAYLSAGVDSSLIVAAMCRFNDRVNTFSIGFNSPIDETRDAAETARFLGTTHHEIQCRPADFGLLPKIVHHMDRPVGDALIIAFHRMAEETAREFKVVLSGEGADEMYAGYSFHKVPLLFELYRKLVPAFLHRGVAMPMLRALPVDLLDKFFEFPAYLGRQGKARLIDFAGNYADRSLLANTMALRTLWAEGERRAIYTEDFKAQATAQWMPEVEIPQEGEFLDRMLKLQYDEWLQDWAIIRQDKNTMAHSLEIRLPFLDHRLIEQAFSMPARLKMRGRRDKIIERRLARKILPPAVVNRPKNPFFLPMEFFFENPEVQELIADTLSEEQVRARGYFDPAAVRRLVDSMEAREFVSLKQVMSLVILELWHRAFIDGEAP